MLAEEVSSTWTLDVRMGDTTADIDVCRHTEAATIMDTVGMHPVTMATHQTIPAGMAGRIIIIMDTPVSSAVPTTAAAIRDIILTNIMHRRITITTMVVIGIGITRNSLARLSARSANQEKTSISANAVQGLSNTSKFDGSAWEVSLGGGRRVLLPRFRANSDRRRGFRRERAALRREGRTDRETHHCHQRPSHTPEGSSPSVSRDTEGIEQPLYLALRKYRSLTTAGEPRLLTATELDDRPAR